MLPPLVLGVVLCHQTKEVQEAVKQPMLAKKEVKKLEEVVKKQQAQVYHYKNQADSLKLLGEKSEKLASQHQQLADSLKTIYDQVPASAATAAELTSFLTNYRPQTSIDTLE